MEPNTPLRPPPCSTEHPSTAGLTGQRTTETFKQLLRAKPALATATQALWEAGNAATHTPPLGEALEALYRASQAVEDEVLRLLDFLTENAP